jgi:hypothetical protein
MLRPVLLPAALLSVAVTLAGADLSGIWVGQLPGRNGDLLDIAFKFSQSGTGLSGKLYGDYGSSPIVEGKVSGDQVSFTIITAEQAGNQINNSRIRFTGSLKDDKLELTREREGSTNAGNGGGVQPRPGAAKQAFTLKRLF